MTDKTYNGWSNYETWCVMLWMDNDQGDQEYWAEVTRDVIESCGDKRPNIFADEQANRRIMLAGRIQEYHEEAADENGPGGGVLSDLLSAALGEVDWCEIAESLLGEVEDDGDE